MKNYEIDSNLAYYTAIKKIFYSKGVNIFLLSFTNMVSYIISTYFAYILAIISI